MTYETLQPFLQWISEHSTWSGIAVFLISLAESLAVIGLIVPGVALMTAIGAMMGSGVLPFTLTLLWAILGAIAGDGISYWLGYHYKQQLREFWPFNKFPQWLDRGQKFFSQHGGKSIVFGRFVGPVRPMIPVIAGMMHMGPRTFLLFNIISAIVWAPLYSLPGILIGASLGNLSKEAAGKIGLLVLITLLLIWLVYSFLFKVAAWAKHKLYNFLDLLWEYAKNRNFCPPLLHTLAISNSNKGQLGAALLLMLSIFSFMLLSMQVSNETGIFTWNEPLRHILRALYDENFMEYFIILTSIAEPKVLLSCSIVVTLFLLYYRNKIAALVWLSTISLGMITCNIIKHSMQIIRPEAYHLANSYSFPSMHTLGATLVFGLSAALIQYHLPKNYRLITWFLSFLLIFTVAFSRIYLDMHWFTDVVAGVILGTIFVTLGFMLYRHFENKSLQWKIIAVPGVLSLCLAYGLFMYIHYPHLHNEIMREWPSEILVPTEWWEAKKLDDLLCRNGAFKRHTCILNLQWLASLPEVHETLEQHAWQILPPFAWNHMFTALEVHPPMNLSPLPEYHRDRMPVLTAVHPGNNQNERLLLQLWQSDLKTEQDVSLWVGVIRYETLKRPIPMVKFYWESPSPKGLLQDFAKKIVHPQLHNKYKIIKANDVTKREILLLDTQDPLAN